MLGRWLWCPNCLHVRWTGYVAEKALFCDPCNRRGDYQLLLDIEPQGVAKAAWAIGGDAAVEALVHEARCGLLGDG